MLAIILFAYILYQLDAGPGGWALYAAMVTMWTISQGCSLAATIIKARD